MRIYDLLLRLINKIKPRLPADSYSTSTISWGSYNRWTCPKTGIVTLYIEPSTQSAHYAYIKDETDGIEVYGHYQSGTIARYSGQFVAIKGHVYTISITNLKSSAYKLTAPTGIGGGTVKVGISRFVRWYRETIHTHKLANPKNKRKKKLEKAWRNNRHNAIQCSEIYRTDVRNQIRWRCSISDCAYRGVNHVWDNTHGWLVSTISYIRQCKHIKRKNNSTATRIYGGIAYIRKINCDILSSRVKGVTV